MKDQELLSAYLDGELSADQAREIEERLSADPRLRAEHLRLRQVSTIFKVECEPDPGFLVRHRERREDLSPVLLWTWRELGYRLTAAAAGLLMAAGLSVWRTEQPAVETLAEATPAAEELDLLAVEDEILATPQLGADFEVLAASGSAAEPVLVIALGGGFAPPGER